MALPHDSRDVGLIVGAVGISALGDFLLWIPLTLHVEAMTDSGLAVAALMICLFGPVLVLAPAAGLLVDRREARGILIVASVAQALVAAILASTLDSLAAILALTALLGAGCVPAKPAEFALVPVIGRGRLTEVNGYVEAARYAGMAAGPLLGGLIAATAGIEAALLADAATFLLVALAGLVLRARRPPAPADEEHPDRARDGVVHLFRDRVLAVVLGVVFVSLLFMSATITAEVFFLREDLGVGDALYGLIFSTWMLGMVIGAVVLSRRVAAASLGAATLVAVGIQGLGIGAPAVWVAVGFTAAAWFVGGVAHGAKNVFARTLIQERVPERIHGRAFAAYNGMRNGAELFALAAGGVLVSAIGARGTLALAGAVPIAAAVIGLALYGRAGRSSPSGSDDSPGSGRPGRRSS